MKMTTCLPVSIAAVLLIPAAGLACAVCASPNPQTAGTYLGMTLMMSLLPLGLVGGLIYWLWRRYS